MAVICSRMFCCMRITAAASGACDSGIEMCRVCTSAGPRESGVDTAQTPGTCGSSARSRSAGPAPAPLCTTARTLRARRRSRLALSDRPPARMDDRQARPRVLHHRDDSEQQSGEQRNRQREDQHRGIDRDFFEARKIRGRHGDQHTAARPRRAPGRALRPAVPAPGFRRAVRARSASIRRPARRGWPVPARALLRAPAGDWRRWRRRSAAPRRWCPSAPTGSCRYRRSRRL